MANENMTKCHWSTFLLQKKRCHKYMEGVCVKEKVNISSSPELDDILIYNTAFQTGISEYCIQKCTKIILHFRRGTEIVPQFATNNVSATMQKKNKKATHFHLF